MDRRTATTAIASLLLGACGGGGGGAGVAAPAAASAPASAGGGTAETASAASPAPQFVARVSPNVALWGDSLTGPMGFNLQLLYPNRQVFNGGVPGETSSQVASRAVADTAHDDWITVFWYGHNNQTQSAQIKADIARSIASLAPGNNRFIVMSLVNQAMPRESRGSADYATIQQLNAELAAAYPQNYLDIRSYLVGLADPNSPQDRLDQQNDVPPSSLRFDHIHLNNEGSVAVARKLQDFIASKAW